MYGAQAHFFEDEIRPHLRHKKKGMAAMAGAAALLYTCLQVITFRRHFFQHDFQRPLMDDVPCRSGGEQKRITVLHHTWH